MSDSLAENPPNPDGIAEKPIVRRRPVETSQWSPELLLQVPDFRASSVAPAESTAADVSDESNLLAQAAEQCANDLSKSTAQSPEPSNEDAAYTIDFNEARTEFGIAPPKDRVGAAAEEHLAQDIERDVSEVAAKVTLPEQKTRSLARAGLSVTTPEVSVFDPDRLSHQLKQNLGTIGTIAAAITACILVASAMKQDPASPALAPTQSVAAQPLVDAPQVPDRAFAAEVTPAAQPIQISTQGVQPPQLTAPQLAPPQNSPATMPRPAAKPDRPRANQNRQAAPTAPWQLAQNPAGPVAQGRPQNFDVTPLQVEPAPTPEKINPFNRPAFRNSETVVPQPQRQQAFGQQQFGQSGFAQPKFAQPQAEFNQPGFDRSGLNHAGLPQPNVAASQNQFQPANQPQAVDPNSLNGIWPAAVNDAQRTLEDLPEQISQRVRETQTQLQQQIPQFQSPADNQQFRAPKFDSVVAPSAQSAAPSQSGLPALSPPANNPTNVGPLNNRVPMPSDLQLPDLGEVPPQVNSQLGGYPSTPSRSIAELKADLEEQRFARRRQELRVGQSTETINNQPRERSFGPGSQFNSNGGAYRR